MKKPPSPDRKRDGGETAKQTFLKAGGCWGRVRPHRDIAAAKRFFTKAIEQHCTPETITLDGYPATHAAVTELKKSGVSRPQVKVRKSRYLNNLIEQDHRRVKQRIYPMLGFKKFANASVTISGIELVQEIRKGQFNTTKLTNRVGGRVPHVWEAVLAT